jgi:tetratricopeptide (TPR) repeat protein
VALDSDNAMLVYSSQLFIIRWYQGRVSELIPDVEQAITGYPTLPALRAALAVALVESGERDRAAGELARAESDLELARRDRQWVVLQVLLAHSSVACGFLSLAETLYEALQPFAGFNTVVGPGLAALGPVDRWLGLLANARGDTTLAMDHLSRAVELADKWGSPVWAVDSRIELAKVLLGSGRLAEGRLLVERTVGLARAADLIALEVRARQPTVVTGGQITGS